MELDAGLYKYIRTSDNFILLSLTAEDQLMEAMNQGNLQKSFSSTSSFLSSSQSYQGHHHHHHQHNFQILALEGPDYVYKPLFGPMGEYQVGLCIHFRVNSLISSILISPNYSSLCQTRVLHVTLFLVTRQQKTV